MHNQYQNMFIQFLCQTKAQSEFDDLDAEKIDVRIYPPNIRIHTLFTLTPKCLNYLFKTEKIDVRIYPPNIRIHIIYVDSEVLEKWTVLCLRKYILEYAAPPHCRVQQPQKSPAENPRRRPHIRGTYIHTFGHSNISTSENHSLWFTVIF